MTTSPEDGRCRITVDTISAGADDITSWYDLWEAAAALEGICARVGRRGIAYALGK